MCNHGNLQVSLLHCQPLGLAKQIVISGHHTLCHISAFHPHAIYPPPKLPVVSEYECMPQVFLGCSHSAD